MDKKEYKAKLKAIKKLKFLPCNIYVKAQNNEKFTLVLKTSNGKLYSLKTFEEIEDNGDIRRLEFTTALKKMNSIDIDEVPAITTMNYLKGRIVDRITGKNILTGRDVLALQKASDKQVIHDRKEAERSRCVNNNLKQSQEELDKILE